MSQQVALRDFTELSKLESYTNLMVNQKLDSFSLTLLIFKYES